MLSKSRFPWRYVDSTSVHVKSITKFTNHCVFGWTIAYSAEPLRIRLNHCVFGCFLLAKVLWWQCLFFHAVDTMTRKWFCSSQPDSLNLWDRCIQWAVNLHQTEYSILQIVLWTAIVYRSLRVSYISHVKRFTYKMWPRLSGNYLSFMNLGIRLTADMVLLEQKY